VGGRGRFGMKDITSHIKIMSDKVYSNKINKQFNHTVLSELSLLILFLLSRRKAKKNNTSPLVFFEEKKQEGCSLILFSSSYLIKYLDS
jgi:hypothetical protein